MCYNESNPCFRRRFIVITYCLFRETVNSPLFESRYDFNTGLIDGISKSKFHVKLGRYFTGFAIPENFILPENKSLYIYALKMLNGLVAFRYYDVGIVVLSKQGVYMVSNETKDFGLYNEEIIGDYLLFNYPHIRIGVYKTVIKQFDIPENSCYLYTDLEGNYLTDKGVVSTGVTKDIGDDIKKIDKFSVFKEGYSGCYIDNDGGLNFIV